jgi:succinoglycan biosynthesis transport protein ExoP
MIPCILIATGLAFALSSRQEKKYSATASLLFQTSEFSQQLFGFSASTGSIDPTAQQATNVELVSEPIIAVDVARNLRGSVTASQVASEISIAAAGAGSIVDVTATDPSPAVAAKLANAYAQQFIAYQQQSDRSQVERAIAQLQTQIGQLAAASTGSSDLKTLQARLSQLQALAALQTGNVQLAEQALVPESPSSPKIRRDTALGLAAGVLVGLLAMFLAERLDGTLRDPKEVAALLGLPVLGMIPSSRGLARNTSVSPLDSTSEAEAFRLLRTQLRYFNVDREIRSLLVTSGDAGDGKSVISWNLARTAAALSPDFKVLLLDADLRRPRINVLADQPGSPGLSELLSSGLSVQDVVRSHRLDAEEDAGPPYELHVITAGALAPNPAELMQSAKLHAVLAEVQDQYDLVIVDAPPSAIVSDAIPVMSQVSGVLVVVRLRHSRRNSLRRLSEQVSQLTAPTLGVIINDVKQSKLDYGGYYGYGSGDAKRGKKAPAVSPREKTAVPS